MRAIVIRIKGFPYTYVQSGNCHKVFSDDGKVLFFLSREIAIDWLESVRRDGTFR